MCKSEGKEKGLKGKKERNNGDMFSVWGAILQVYSLCLWQDVAKSMNEVYFFTGYLKFVDLSNVKTSTVSMNSFGSVTLTDGFRFGDSNVYKIYVS